MYIENKNKRLTDARIPIALSMGKMEILIKKWKNKFVKFGIVRILLELDFFVILQLDIIII